MAQPGVLDGRASRFRPPTSAWASDGQARRRSGRPSLSTRYLEPGPVRPGCGLKTLAVPPDPQPPPVPTLARPSVRLPARGAAEGVGAGGRPGGNRAGLGRRRSGLPPSPWEALPPRRLPGLSAWMVFFCFLLKPPDGLGRLPSGAARRGAGPCPARGGRDGRRCLPPGLSCTGRFGPTSGTKQKVACDSWRWITRLARR